MASGLSRFEEFAEKLVEGAFEKLGRHRLEPVEIARRLSRTMEDDQTISAGKRFAPNVYRVGLHPETFQAFVSFKEPLEEELASYLSDEAERQGFHFIGRPHVILTPETTVRRGRLTVSAELAGGPSASIRDLDATQAMRTEEIRAATRAGQKDSAEQLQFVIGKRTIPLEQPPLNVGRSLDNDVIIQAAGVSRRHAQIVFRHGRWLVRDLNSTHGTQVNGHDIDECVLRAGDTVIFGDVTAEVQPKPSSERSEEREDNGQ